MLHKRRSVWHLLHGIYLSLQSSAVHFVAGFNGRTYRRSMQYNKGGEGGGQPTGGQQRGGQTGGQSSGGQQRGGQTGEQPSGGQQRGGQTGGQSSGGHSGGSSGGQGMLQGQINPNEVTHGWSHLLSRFSINTKSLRR